MPQIVLLILLTAAAWIIWNQYRENKTNNRPLKNKKQQQPSRKGKVIDISNVWTEPKNIPYQKKPGVLDDRELVFYNRIGTVLAESNYTAYPKIALDEIITLPSRLQNRQKYIDNLKTRSADILICELPYLNPQIIIFIEDKQAKKQQILNRFTAKAVETSGIQYLIYNINTLPTLEKLTEDLISMGIVLREKA